MRHSPRSLHRSEIMTSGWCSGGRVVRGRSHQAEVCAGTAGSSFLEQAASLPVPNGWGTLAPGQPVRSDRRVRRRRVYPGTRAGEAQNPDRPARREPHYNCGLPARGSSLAGPASLPRNEAGFFLIDPRPHGRRRFRHVRALCPTAPSTTLRWGGSPETLCPMSLKSSVSRPGSSPAKRGGAEGGGGGRPQHNAIQRSMAASIPLHHKNPAARVPSGPRAARSSAALCRLTSCSA